MLINLNIKRVPVKKGPFPQKFQFTDGYTPSSLQACRLEFCRNFSLIWQLFFSILNSQFSILFPTSVPPRRFHRPSVPPRPGFFFVPPTTASFWIVSRRVLLSLCPPDGIFPTDTHPNYQYNQPIHRQLIIHRPEKYPKNKVLNYSS
jgi:hypothetical protein